MPSLFICHGSPMMAIQHTPYTASLAEIGRQFQPKAIVIFTAHWESSVTTISFVEGIYETMYDFGGFDPELYRINYPARGLPVVAELVEQRLEAAGIRTNRDAVRGLDHGAWVVLRKIFPDASIPVVQVSVNPYLSPREQFEIGAALRDLGNQEIMVIGSGGTSHNLRNIKWGQIEPEPWTVAFDDWLLEGAAHKDYEKLFEYETLAPHARLAVPRAEHFVPFYIAMGAGKSSTTKVWHRSYEFGTLSLISLEF